MLATVGICALLLIGSFFCFVKYQDLRNGTQHLHQYEPVFRWLRWGIPVLLVIMALIVFATARTAETSERLLGALLYLLAVLEYINYFQVQLMYDTARDFQYLGTHKRLKRGLIAREFDW